MPGGPTISARAYTKIVFHAAKYPHCAVNGLLLATKESLKPNSDPYIQDVIPLFHQCLYVSPMSEIALVQVENMASKEGLQIVGYYAGCENFNDNTIDRAPGLKIAEKIAEIYSRAVAIVVDNHNVSLNMEQAAVNTWNWNDGRWIKTNFQLENSRQTLETVSILLQRGAMKDLNDFDNYLDDMESDWTNALLNKDLSSILTMY